MWRSLYHVGLAKSLYHCIMWHSLYHVRLAEAQHVDELPLLQNDHGCIHQHPCKTNPTVRRGSEGGQEGSEVSVVFSKQSETLVYPIRDDDFQIRVVCLG